MEQATLDGGDVVGTESDPIVEVWHGIPILRSQLARMARSSDLLKRTREKANYRIRAGDSNCARCDRIGDFNGEHQSGYCMLLRHMVATHYTVACEAFTPRVRPKAEAVLQAHAKAQAEERRLNEKGI